MDIADINIISNRKRINEDAEKLREKVSRESAKIIKLKVAQDTAYWDLKEKLHQLENNHERLQQNMVDMQMIHETVSSQHQDELRLRPETLNKLCSTRQICDVLEDYSERLKGTLSRCKTDQTLLFEAYQRSGQIVKDIKTRHTQDDEMNKSLISNLEEKFKLTLDHQSQLVQLLNSSRQKADEDLRVLNAKLVAALGQKDELRKAVNDSILELDRKNYEIKTSEKNISSLQTEMKRIVLEHSARLAEDAAAAARLQTDLKEASKSKETLEIALANQQQYTKDVRDENCVLKEKLSTLEKDALMIQKEVELMGTRLEDVTNTCGVLRKDVTSLVKAKKVLETDIEQKKQLLEAASEEAKNLKAQLNIEEYEKTSVQKNLGLLAAEAAAKTEEIAKLQETLKVFKNKVAQLECILEETGALNEQRTKDLTQTIETKTSENKSKSETICKLMSDVANCLEERSRLELIIEREKIDMEVEKERRDEKERELAKQVDRLEGAVKEKDQEISKNISIVIEMRAEKERLQMKISAMQNTIDNIGKELSGRPMHRDPGTQPEPDDNACSEPIKRMAHSTPKSASRPLLPEPPRFDPCDSLLYDSSLEGDVVDPIEINRRFEALARGERLSPAPLSALKRRRGAARTDENQLSQLREEIKTNEKRMFFKSKRPRELLKRFKKNDLDGKNN